MSGHGRSHAHGLVREGLAALVLGLIAAAATFWPLPLHLSSAIPKELADPLLQAWQVAWGGHALTTQPLDYFQANIFWPLENTLAFSDALVGYSPAGLLGSGFEAALVRYNLLFLLAYGLAFAGAYLLSRELGLGRGASLVAGAAFAYAPWRLEQANHLHVISSGGIPLAAFLLIRGYRLRRPGLVLAGWMAAAWQLSLGFTLGVPMAYGLAVVALACLVVWLRRGRPSPDRRLARATTAGLVLFTVVAYVLARPYLTVLEEHPEARRIPYEVLQFSPPPRGFLVAPESNALWGSVAVKVRESLPWAPEQSLFPGMAISLLALLGLWLGPWSRAARVAAVLAIGAVVVLSTGLSVWNGNFGYRWLYEFAPGWDGLRTPGRLNTFTSLGLAMFAAAGAQVVATRLRRSPGVPRGPAVALAVLLAVVVVLEGSAVGLHGDGRGAILSGPELKAVPPPPEGQVGLPGPQLHLPLPERGDFTDVSAFEQMLWSTEGFPRIAEGSSGFTPTFFVSFPERVQQFPDAPTIGYLRRLGVRTVVLDPERAKGTALADWRRSNPELLGVSVRRAGDVVLYDLGPRSRSQMLAPEPAHARL